MNKKIAKLCVVMALTFLLASCSTLRYFNLIPTVNVTSLKMSSLDLDGMNFTLSYRVDNPYPVDLTLAELDLDVLYFDDLLLKVDSVDPFEIRAQRTSKHTLNFKIPYDKILSFTKSVRGKTMVNCTLNGAAYIDYSSYASFMNKIDSKLPILYTFSVPIMKPSFSVSNFKFTPPSLMNLNAGISFDLSVTENASAAWECEIKNCSLKDGDNNLIALKTDGNATISSSNKSVRVTAELNPVSAAGFIAKLIKKEGSNPVFVADSEFVFINSSYNYAVPLSYSKEIPLTEFVSAN